MEQWQKLNQVTINRAVSLIRLIPFTRAIMLTGSVAEGKEHKQSDIDLFIQVKKGTIWTTRFFVTIIVQLAGIRRTDNDITGKICLNWYATYNAPEQQQGRVYQTLWNGKPWFGKGTLELAATILTLWWSEPLLRAYQIYRIEKDPRTHATGSMVRYSDQELGFHPPKGYSLNEH